MAAPQLGQTPDRTGGAGLRAVRHALLAPPARCPAAGIATARSAGGGPRSLLRSVARPNTTATNSRPTTCGRSKACGIWMAARTRFCANSSILRDREARRQNRPAFKVIGDKTLLQLAERAPRTLDELNGIEGMTGGQLQRYGAALLEAIARGRKDPLPAPPRRTQIDPDVIRALRKAARLAQAGRGSARRRTGRDRQQRRLDGDSRSAGRARSSSCPPCPGSASGGAAPTARRCFRS